MKITNNHNLPNHIVQLASRSTYSKGKAEYSVTELLSPPRIRRLREQHINELTQDVSEMLWALMGSALHVVLERGTTPNTLTEERLFLDINGTTISGQIDLQEHTPQGVVITDHKFTSVWSVMNGKADWEAQLNIYRYLVEKVKQQKVYKLQILAFLRDWNRHEMKPDYPPTQVHVVDIPIWDLDKAEQFIQNRLELHRDSKLSHAWGDGLPECTSEDRWESETTYAVRREGRKTAIRVFKTLQEATELANKEKGYVETRIGESKRCTGNWCGVAEFCDQYRASLSNSERQLED